MPVLKAPFPWFGGKSRIAPLVWDRLGEVDNYVEPFAGSCAVLLGGPHAPRVETVNDLDAHVANFWRATQSDPEAVVEHCDYPVSELDLHARHRWLVLGEGAAEFRERMRSDPDHYDPKRAGWWCWGLCCWIGGGWCSHSDGPGRRPALTDQGEGVHGEHPEGWEQIPLIGDAPRGVHRGAAPANAGRPQLADAYSRGRGVHGTDTPVAPLHEQRPPLRANQSGYTGQGVAQERREIGTCAQRRQWLLDWFGRLRDRLRSVRVCCGHWLRVCDSESVTTRIGTVGLFLDPPYPTMGGSRAAGLYAQDGSPQSLDQLRDEVLSYCRERGPDRRMRICVCGYQGDGYEALCAEGWQEVAWRAQGGYGNRTRKGRTNAGRERLWFSPGCQAARERGLFD